MTVAEFMARLGRLRETEPELAESLRQALAETVVALQKPTSLTERALSQED